MRMGLGMVAVLMLPTVVHIYFLADLGQADFMAVLMGYVGILLMAAALFSIGLFVSSLCNNQISAGVITLVVSMLLISIQSVGFLIQSEENFWRRLCLRLSFIDNINPFMMGIFDTRPLVLFATIIGGFLFLTVRVVESRRWR
jgi:ABC-2 type transport system permease protein